MAADPEAATAPLAETETGSRSVAAKAGTRLATLGGDAAGARGETARRAARALAAATRTGTRHTAVGARAPIVDRSATAKAGRGPLSGAASGHARPRDDGRRRATEDEGDRVTGNGVRRAATHADEAPEAAEARTRIGVAETATGEKSGGPPANGARPATEEARIEDEAATRAAPIAVGRGRGPISGATTGVLVRVATAMSAATTETAQGVQNGETPETTAQLDRARGGAHAAKTGHPVAARGSVPHAGSGAETCGHGAMRKSRKENRSIRAWSPGPTNRRHPPR